MIGIFSKTTDSNFVEAAGLAGLDFIILDREHGPVSWHRLHDHVRAAQRAGMKAVIRVARNDDHEIGASLDSGADGVQVPNVSGVEEAERAVRAARFQPDGMRGVCRFVRAARFGTMDKADYFRNANETMVVLQVEGLAGVRALDGILGVKGFDVLFVGPYDLSQSAGVPGEVSHPKVVELMESIAAKVRGSGKMLGTFADTPENARIYRSAGFEYLAYSVDVALFADKIKSIKELCT